MKPKVYIETRVISYLTAKLSRDLITAGHQQITQDWWKHRRQEFTLHISQLVVKEARAGHTTAARKRLSVLPDIPILLPNDEVTQLTDELLLQQALPTKAADDAVHLALATPFIKWTIYSPGIADTWPMRNFKKPWPEFVNNKAIICLSFAHLTH